MITQCPILKALGVDEARALEELHNDWTTYQDLSDVLMRKFQLPFRVGRSFAGNLVTYAKQHKLGPREFPFEEAQRIFAAAIKTHGLNIVFPMMEEEFRDTLNPTKVVANRVTHGGHQLTEMTRMIALAKQDVRSQKHWAMTKRLTIDNALEKLDRDFMKYVQ